jgi:hypothetical protein
MGKIIGIHGATVCRYTMYRYIEKQWFSLEGIPVKVDFLDNGFTVIPQGGEIWHRNLPNAVKASIIRLEVIHNGQRESHSANCHSNGDVRRMQRAGY